jgi:hypothetical protein
VPGAAFRGRRGRPIRVLALGEGRNGVGAGRQSFAALRSEAEVASPFPGGIFGLEYIYRM